MVSIQTLCDRLRTVFVPSSRKQQCMSHATMLDTSFFFSSHPNPYIEHTHKKNLFNQSGKPNPVRDEACQ